jgi:hypothetical protein
MPPLPKVSRTHGPQRVIRYDSKTLRHSPLLELATSLLFNPNWLLAGFFLLLIGGCASIDPSALDRNHLEYAQAVADAEET